MVRRVHSTLPRLPFNFAVRIMESELQHRKAKRSYAEFNKMLNLAHGEGFIVQPNPFRSQLPYIVVTTC